jgi:Mycothiol-dependent nitroreductase Rv2466c
MAAPASPTPVEFFFDPGCPFTWRTSRWPTEVANAGTAVVTWRLMSLGVLNEGNENPRPRSRTRAHAGAPVHTLHDVHGRGRVCMDGWHDGTAHGIDVPAQRRRRPAHRQPRRAAFAQITTPKHLLPRRCRDGRCLMGWPGAPRLRISRP